MCRSLYNRCVDYSAGTFTRCYFPYQALDSALLPAALWSSFPELRATLPEEVADRALIFHRGVDVVKMRGKYFKMKVNLLISFWILQPLFKLLFWILSKVGLKKVAPTEAPAYMATFEEVPTVGVASEGDGKGGVDVKKEERKVAGAGHVHAVKVERRTFASVFPDGVTTFKALLKTVEVQEACFKDVVSKFL
jgi:hypothetical protein